MKLFNRKISGKAGAFCALLLLGVVAFSGAALASPDASGEHGFTPEMWKNFAYRVANFVLFVGIIVYFAGAKIKNGLKKRTDDIASELQNLEDAKKAAAAHLADVEKRIANLEQERASIIKEYEAQGERLKQAIIEKAEKSAGQIIAQAERTAQNEFKQAVEDIRSEIAELVAASVETRIKQQLDAGEHEKLIDKYLTKVVLH